MTKWILAVALTLSAFSSRAFAVSKGDLIGTWKLISSKDNNEKGEVKDSYTRNPTDFLTYTTDGRMMAIISNDGRKPLSGDWISFPVEERADAYATSVAYAGSYTFYGDKVIHHVQASTVQNFVNTDFLRFITKVDRNRLVLRTAPLVKGGERVTQDLVWERKKPTQ